MAQSQAISGGVKVVRFAAAPVRLEPGALGEMLHAALGIGLLGFSSIVLWTALAAVFGG